MHVWLPSIFLHCWDLCLFFFYFLNLWPWIKELLFLLFFKWNLLLISNWFVSNKHKLNNRSMTPNKQTNNKMVPVLAGVWRGNTIRCFSTAKFPVLVLKFLFKKLVMSTKKVWHHCVNNTMTRKRCLIFLFFFFFAKPFSPSDLVKNLKPNF